MNETIACKFSNITECSQDLVFLTEEIKKVIS